MFFGENQKLSRAIFYGIAIVITIASLWYSNFLVRKLAQEEEKRVQIYAEGLEYMTNPIDNCLDTSCGDCYSSGITFVLNNILRNNEIIPTLLVDQQGKVTSVKGIEPPQGVEEGSPEYQDFMQEVYLDMKSSNKNRPIELTEGLVKNYVYFDESSMLKQLRIFPYLQLIVIIIFFGILFITFSVAKKNEQNRVWVGLAKETAHQLGTPVSSLMAWVELLKLKLEGKTEDEQMIGELEKDVNRLSIITERFSKIGSEPELVPANVAAVLTSSADYIHKRMSKRVQLKVRNELPAETTFKVNQPLFEWVIENLLKNALDAIEGGEGEITIQTSEKGKLFFIDISDTGKGIPRGNFEDVFKPGFTTKKRGWGLGLSLTRRIIENYHKGKIFVKDSTVGKGTTFRIQLPKD